MNICIHVLADPGALEIVIILSLMRHTHVKLIDLEVLENQTILVEKINLISL